MSWVEVYEYDLGFCLLWALITIIENEQGRIGAEHKKKTRRVQSRKESVSMGTLTVKGAMQVLNFPNLFTLLGTAKILVKCEQH